jgi:aminoglycoside phosphotransferase (APT) family kinase protein
VTSPPNTTTDGLLAALRRHTAIDELAWARPPRPLTGGFWAEIYDIELAHPPAHLTGRLVARIMPDPVVAARETAIQRHLSDCGLHVPAIHAADGPSDLLDRAWSIMDHAPGRPLLTGLSARSALRRAPTLLHRIPDLLARSAAALHDCPTDRLELELHGHTHHAGIDDQLTRLADQASSNGRDDLAAIARQLAASAPPGRVVCHGDLHPLNLLVDDDRWTLIDWSTAMLADPHYDLAFTTLMLANPPLDGPTPIRAIARSIGNRLAHRFVRTYEQLTGTDTDPARLAWGRRAHALRALVDVATWTAHGDLANHTGHPWLTLRRVLESELAGA